MIVSQKEYSVLIDLFSNTCTGNVSVVQDDPFLQGKPRFFCETDHVVFQDEHVTRFFKRPT